MNAILTAYNFLKGKKTYIVGVCAIVYGVAYKDASVLAIGLSACGLRAGISNEIANIAVGK